jgi:hypothetical protein
MYYGVGLWTFLLGVLVGIACLAVAVDDAWNGDYSRAALDIFVLAPLGVALALCGRWMMRNRRGPFTPPNRPPPTGT